MLSSIFNDPEYAELDKLIRCRKTTPKQLLEEKLAPLQSKISESQGELVGAITRHYHSHHGMSPYWSTLKETFYAGIITPKTKFSSEGTEDLFRFMSGIKNSISFSFGSISENEFKKEEKGNFGRFLTDNWKFLYFHDRPPQAFADTSDHGCFGGQRMRFPTEEPRLELHIGDKETIPFFQRRLDGWQYSQLSGLLEYNLPITDEIREKIEQEQLEIFDEIIKTEDKARALSGEKERRINLLKAKGGAIYHSTHIELTDEMVERMRYNPQIKEARDQVESLLRRAIKRGYHENGVEITRRMDAGVTTHINLKEFFSQRKAMLEL